MKKPLLSICIPTYNRSHYLRNSLNSIVCQKEFQDGSVEIVISDNASTDDTQFMIKEYMSQYENICYFRNSKNLGDKNFPLSLSRGKGLYRKLSNDTFLYFPNSLNYFCNLVQRYKDTEKILCFLDGKGKDLKDEIVECTSFDQFVGTVGWLIHWTGPFGLWESECENITNDLSGCELMLWQCQKLYEMMASKKDALFINRRLFIVQEVNHKNMSYGLYQVLHINLMSILSDYVGKKLLLQETYEKVRIGNLYNIFVPFLTRGEHKRKQWNFPDKEKVKDLVFNEVQQVGCLQDFKKHYNRSKYLYPIRTNFKIICINAYCTYLSMRSNKMKKKCLKYGVNQ